VRGVVEEGVQAGEAELDPKWEKLTSLRHTAMLWSTLGAFAMAIYAIYVLLTGLWWG
jgi:hypothetical protein